jgi:hypothetical protein
MQLCQLEPPIYLFSMLPAPRRGKYINLTEVDRIIDLILHPTPAPPLKGRGEKDTGIFAALWAAKIPSKVIFGG